ncbi:MAG: bacteriohemerythrin [Magnetococcales bacterium]|nr:bacteriohemerythrin [Magnetococcales bacterium]
MSQITKIQICKGVYWVEIPQAGLKVLCGCPADSVKHLMKRGLIVTMETKGVPYETGPSAILLSDLVIQNGHIANLAEFPVMQMLYKQGMILPNHPNNTGAKPLLIGRGEQVKSQMQTIFRGNYGLISEDEILETGTPPEDAEWMMRIKRWFAFGNIRPFQELLEARIVEDSPVEIQNGAFIQRKRLNVFEFQYDDERVSVDLNLGPNDAYESAYPLGFQRIKREYFGIIHSGEGDGWDVDRPTMSSILMFQGKIYLIDAGPNLLYSLTALGIGISEIEGLFHTHAHDDHFAGIATLMRAGHRIKYYATPLVRASVEKKWSALLSLDTQAFADFFDIQDLTFERWNQIEGLEVKPIFSPHPVETSLFLFRTLWENGYPTYAHFADISAFDVLKRMITDSPTEPGISATFFETVRSAYLTPADLKKLDIGGGLIHGRAEDFRDDASGKILLSHIARELTDAEKEIGSSAPFGVTDTLIPDRSDSLRRSAYEFLRSYFPTAKRHDFRILLNSELGELNPGTIILKEHEVNKTIFLILAGSVERIQTKQNLKSVLSAGSLLGDLTGLYQLPSPATYRTASFVQVLKFPFRIYLEFVKRNDLYSKIEAIHEARDLLEQTSLFGEGLSHTTQIEVAESMHLHQYQTGEEVAAGEERDFLYLVKRGRMERFLGEESIEMLGPRDFFGEETAVFDTPSLFGIRAVSRTDVYRIPAKVVRAIPIVRLKLFEAFRKRMGILLESEKRLTLFHWREAFSINVQVMDAQHRKLLQVADSIHAVLNRSETPQQSVHKSLKILIEFAKCHFHDEEELMIRHGYEALASHRQQHEVLLERIHAFQVQLQMEADWSGIDFPRFFKEWIIDHILPEDKKFGSFLNGKGIY